jgi:Queuosine salvage protein
MESSLLERVRVACEAVASRADHVRIDHDLVRSYAASLPLDRVALPVLEPTLHYLGHGDDTLAFVLTLDAINFGSGYFPLLRKRPGLSGYFTIAASLNDYFNEHGPLSAQRLAQVTAADCTKIFGQDLDNEPIHELMQLFATALNDLGRFLVDRFDGNFAGVVEAAGSSAERLVQLLVEMPYFNDVEPCNGMEVPFYKRAQLTAADLSVAFEGKGRGNFDDLERLTIFADNLVPHVLRVDGILLYEEALAARIDSEQLIPSGSIEEVEIRACAVHAVELLSKELHESGHKVTAMELDYLLWNRGQQPYYKAWPRHRTRTVFY